MSLNRNKNEEKKKGPDYFIFPYFSRQTLGL